LFAAVILLGVYPALIAAARADALARDRAAALVIATNAVADEQAADAYGRRLPDGVAVTRVDGFTLTVTVTPAAPRFMSDLDVQVADAGGRVLAHVVSFLGPPVLPPRQSGT